MAIEKDTPEITRLTIILGAGSYPYPETAEIIDIYSVTLGKLRNSTLK